jgi:universal stress protein E
MSWKRILFSVDSAEAVPLAALDKVARLASAMSAELELFQCVFDPALASSIYADAGRASPYIRALVGRADEKLARAATALREQGVRASSSVRWDHPLYEGIVRQALRHEADLVVAQPIHGERLAPRWLSYTDFKLIETCPSPLLLIKNPHPYAKGSILAAVDPLHMHDEPAALDRAIVETSAVLSQALGAPLALFHSRIPWPYSRRIGAELRRDPVTGEGDTEAACRMDVEARVAKLSKEHDIPSNRTFVVDGPVADTLPEFARTHATDIVAMGAVSRSLIKRVLIGHTAERLLDTLACDVLIIKPPGFLTPVGGQSTHHVDTEATTLATYLRE